MISGIAGLWELVGEHQERCEVERIRRLRMTADGPRAGRRSRRSWPEMIRYDTELRSLVVARAGLEAGMTDFLFGRPLQQVLRAMELAERAGGCAHRGPGTGRRPADVVGQLGRRQRRVPASPVFGSAARRRPPCRLAPLPQMNLPYFT
ncbi:MAG: hypothetical protein MZU95_03390 [Desulfomicrobium escambiense]|nr:hypothetical protein [Desulfomicrobium escambiense]